MRLLRRRRRHRGAEAFRLSAGAHVSSADGMCAMELVAWIAGEGHTDAPESTYPVLAGVVRCMNDTLGEEAVASMFSLLDEMLAGRLSGR